MENICPCCNGSGKISRRAGYSNGAGMTAMQARLYDAVRRAPPGGIATEDLAGIIYANRSDGGPDTASHCISVFAHYANKHLKKVGERIVGRRGRGSTFRLEKI